MAVPFTTEVQDSVPRVDGQVAVGEDLEFQRKWWKFERGLWIFFCLILVCDIIGVFGQGFVSKTKQSAADGSLTVQYYRVMRAGTPGTMMLQFGPGAVKNGQIMLYASDSLVTELGVERVVPQPQSSMVGAGGVTYTFPAGGGPWKVEMQLSPKSPGMHRFTMQVPGGNVIGGRAFVMP